MGFHWLIAWPHRSSGAEWDLRAPCVATLPPPILSSWPHDMRKSADGRYRSIGARSGSRSDGADRRGVSSCLAQDGPWLGGCNVRSGCDWLYPLEPSRCVTLASRCATVHWNSCAICSVLFLGARQADLRG